MLVSFVEQIVKNWDQHLKFTDFSKNYYVQTFYVYRSEMTVKTKLTRAPPTS